jgi:trans-aconitate methyltransferase
VSLREWNAAQYHCLSEPQVAWGARVLEAIELRGDERVLDAGCGTGRVTAMLAGRVPRGRLVALDRSRQMLERAREVLAPHRALLVCATLPDVPLVAAVELIFSTATFHWVLDHPALFRAMHRALVPGGRLVAQCGGAGNLDRLHTRARRLMQSPAFAAAFAAWTPPWEFADADTTARRLGEAGFERVETWLEPAPTVLADAERYAAFLTTVIFRDHLNYLRNEASRRAFIGELTAEGAGDTPRFSLDYQRLNVVARKP